MGWMASVRVTINVERELPYGRVEVETQRMTTDPDAVYGAIAMAADEAVERSRAATAQTGDE